MADNTNTANPVEELITTATSETSDSSALKDLSLEALILLINTERLNTLEKNIRNEFSELKPRQDQVAFLHKLLKAVNSSTSDKGSFDWTKNEDLQQLLDEARQMGVDIPDGKVKFNHDERERLIDNVKMTVQDLNVQNDMQLQQITRLNNERYESFQLARMAMKPLHDSKIQTARNTK